MKMVWGRVGWRSHFRRGVEVILGEELKQPRSAYLEVSCIWIFKSSGIKMGVVVEE